jgi:hypothetical protein
MALYQDGSLWFCLFLFISGHDCVLLCYYACEFSALIYLVPRLAYTSTSSQKQYI